MNVLITGGAGFIGSHLADALLTSGHTVRVFDNLDPQVHGKERHVPGYLDRNVEFRLGDIRDSVAVKDALRDIEVVFQHQPLDSRDDSESRRGLNFIHSSTGVGASPSTVNAAQ